MSRWSTHWRQVPRIAKVAWAGFLVLFALTFAIAAVFFPEGGTGLAYVLIPGQLDLVLIGSLVLTNYRGTADALLGLQLVLWDYWPPLFGPRPSRGMNRFIAVMFVVGGIGMAIAGPLFA